MDRDEEQRRRRGEHTRSYSQDRPIGSGENAKSILRGVKQWMPDVFGSVGDLGDAASYAVRKVLQGQGNRTVPSTGWGEGIRRKASKKAPLEQVQMTETPETNWFEEGTRMLNPAMFMSPKNIATMGGLALAGGVPGASMAIVKPRGGNWFTGSGSELESAIKNLMKGSGDNYRTLIAKGLIDEAAVKAKPEYALNKWLEGPLTRYLKRDLGTEADPVRKLLEGDRPVSHMRLDELQGNAGEDWISRKALRNRATAGLPYAGVGQSGPSQAWETLTDAMIGSNPAGETFKLQSQWDPKHPMAQDWVSKLPEDSPIYDFIGDEAPDWLGLPHLMDELWNAVREGSDLPENLRLKPEDFQQMGIEKAVRLVADINNWRANAKAAASQNMLGGPGVKLLREYPENNPKGLRWVELKASEWKPPEGYEYDARTGTWQDPYSESMQPIRSPGVDRESLSRQLKYEGDTMGHCVGGYCDDVLSGTARIFSLRDAKGEPHVTIEVAPTDIGDVIQQIKGKQNLPPKDEYLPFVRDFLSNPYHGSSWQDAIGDLNSLGLSPEDIEKIPRAYARGGLVGRQELNGAVGYILD